MTLTLDSLDKMEHFRGHLFNWYDTRTLAPLNPRYVSSVDSGNMAGHLLTLREGLSAMRYQPVLNSEQLLAGLNDTLIILENTGAKRANRPAAAAQALSERGVVACGPAVRRTEENARPM